MRWMIAAFLALATAGASIASDRPDLGPRAAFPVPDMDAVELGQLLFYDPILSGNRNISCATCHHPRFGTSDGVSLSLGEGGIGLGPDRRADPENLPEQRLPRNAPALWNLGAEEFRVMFHDGRLEDHPDFPGGIRTPLGEDMVQGFDDALAAQAMFPVLSADEMAGHYSENEVAQAVRLGQLSQPGGAWDRIAARVEAIPEYRQRFDVVLGEEVPVTFAEIGNILADFIRFEWRADNSPFDRYMLGMGKLSHVEQSGMDLFYGAAQCSSCHSGWFQTDHDFHALAIPQIGPGKAARFENHARDEGRIRVTGVLDQAYAFRTPSLRNVTLTGPYGHSGAYATLEAVLRHHLDPAARLADYDRSQAVLPPLKGSQDFRMLEDAEERARLVQAAVPKGPDLDDTQIAALVAFLWALTDDGAAAGRLGVPKAVPSGLPVDR
ncbi:Cytochrome c551 peroxidase precursor [Tritonibacter multivorans]|uniref:Cytochrome c551 peroxidase n=1 Tax=Tritonibacter multivorans TaxID=928856 RepID=A0A0P1GDR5_9RHOB|nr:cytochrome c peroxidase [Tritonibacter multivorans]MDA7419998.1 cytochrome-c peroxidase [Tritonibacter multivorans]CUH79486.1 Cytochrome c551 peroxidase precursor [Tritonibacter multivorans]SFC08850.1 cytochrome c peroxidase [Tritonibacter multivorans]